MTTLADNMRAIRPWQILVLVVAPFIVAGMVYGAYTGRRHHGQRD